MRSFTFRHLERLVVLLAVVVYLYAAFTLLAQPEWVSGDSYGLTAVTDTQEKHPAVTGADPASGSLTKANPETPPFLCRHGKLALLRLKDTLSDTAAMSGSRIIPSVPAPLCDQTRHNMYLDAPNQKEETRHITVAPRAPANRLTDPRRRPNGQRVFTPKRQRRAAGPSKPRKAQTRFP